ncbi:hypothetical protein IMY05_C4702000100 [Salix suchowensis]|nr:hypothetical protein IMY05_C4702000100 [Salix suchowensis]
MVTDTGVLAWDCQCSIDYLICEDKTAAEGHPDLGGPACICSQRLESGEAASNAGQSLVSYLRNISTRACHIPYNILPHDPCEYPLLTINNDEELPLLITPRNPSPQQPAIIASLDSIDDEASLVNEFGLSIDGAEAHEVLGYGDDDDEDNDDVNGEVDDLGEGEDNTESFQSYQTQLRVSAVLHAEGNRRQGGLKTQKAVVRAWEEFRTLARFEGQIQDDIVDEHSLLSFIQYSAERPKRTRRGHPIPGTFVGAVGQDLISGLYDIR